MEISKELLEQVLDYAIIKNSKIDDDINVKVHFKNYQNRYEDDKINIYELAHKCKEWAFKEGFVIRTYYFDSARFENKKMCNATVGKRKIGDVYTFCFDTEPEAIFRACEWILEQKKIK